jgi:hypothetical protein
MRGGDVEQQCLRDEYLRDRAGVRVGINMVNVGGRDAVDGITQNRLRVVRAHAQ